MRLGKTSFLSAIATVTKLLSSFVLAKIVAVFIGPAGLALIGQLQNAYTLAQSFSGYLIQAGLIKYVAEHHDNPEEKRKVISSGFRFTLYCALLASIIVLVLHQKLALWVLGSAQYSDIFIVFSVSLILFVINMFFLSIINGEQKIGQLTAINMVTSIFSMCVMTSLALMYGLKGALIAVLMNQSIIVFLTLYLLRKAPWFSWEVLFAKVDWFYVKKLMQYALVAVVSGIALPISQIIIRTYIGHTLSWTQAGFWQGMVTFSNAYLLFFTTLLTVYYYPKFSSLKDKRAVRAEVFRAYKIFLPIILVLCFVIYELRYVIIEVVTTKQFYPMAKLFLFQLIGDFLRIGAWLFGAIIISKAMIKSALLVETCLGVCYVCLSLLFIKHYGIIGATMAFACSYGLYWLLMAVLVRKYIFIKE
jgi:polysaccharide transporter, PST family